MIIETAHAKINFTLSVGSKRADGYHSIDSLMHSISLSDRITLTKAEAITLSVTEGEAPLGRENLMVRAAERFFEETGLSGGVSMTLAKRIPSEAGMGGGSSDAAAVLRGLARLYETELSLATLARWGASLGADIPFCVVAGAARCQGIGEKLTPLTPWRICRSSSCVRRSRSRRGRRTSFSITWGSVPWIRRPLPSKRSAAEIRAHSPARSRMISRQGCFLWSRSFGKRLRISRRWAGLRS